MFIVPIMVIIGIVNDNNLWLYLALGLTTFGTTLKAAKDQAAKKAAADQLTSGIDNLLKGLRATQN